jgi:FSR family fosmidomycin resistance protein-like MFS transporter
MNKKVLGLLGTGHAVTDINQGALPIILTFLQPVLMLSQLQVGMVMLSFNLSSSVIQPAFGIFSDRFRAVWLIPAGCFLSGLGMAFAGYASGYHILMMAALLSGIGIAAYHPEGSKFARLASGSRKATGMSIYSVGGNFGFAAGPVLAALFFELAGLKGTAGFFVLNGIMSLVLVFYLSKIETAENVVKEIPSTATKGQPLDQHRGPGSFNVAVAVFLLVAVVVMRSWIHFGLVTFLPQYYVLHLHHSSTYAAALVTLFLFSGAIGTLIGGPAADRWGLKKVIIASMALMVPLLYFFPHSKGIWTLVVVALAGFVLISTFAVTVVFGQELLPNNTGLAAGLTMGFGIGMGGVGATLLGWIADTWGLPSIFGVMMFFPLIGLLLALFLPGKKKLAAAEH